MKKVHEELPPDTLLNQLLARKTILQQILASKEKTKQAAPKGHLRIIKNKGCAQYYHVTKPKSNGKYICKKDIQIARALVQRDYDKVLLPELQKELGRINSLISALSKHPLSKIYEAFSMERQKLIEPITLPTNQYVNLWLQEDYHKKPFSPDAPKYYTSTGLRVRSKSEIIIAETLIRMKIPFKYEYPLKLKAFNVHPDFYCLNTRTRQEFIWEHFGMLDDFDYLKSAMEKLDLYEQSGIFQGVNLITTRETKDKPLNTKAIETKISQFLL